MKSHIKKIFSGEYDVDFYTKNPLILDIGGNVGGFARWASGRWANSKIICFEPIKQNFELLKKNTEDLKNVNLYNCAVGSSNRKQKMFYGKNNEGECSFHLGDQQIEEGEEVDVICADNLPDSHFIKIDTEGSEVEILENIKKNPHIYAIEYHSESNRLKIDELLKEKYVLISSHSTNLNYGILKYALKSSIISDDKIKTKRKNPKKK